MNINYLFLSVSLALSACAAPNISNDFSLEKAAASGVVTGTITYDGGYAAYRLHVENKETGQRFLIAHGSSQTLNLSFVFKGEDPNRVLGKKGSAFAIELPAGTYVVRSWQVSQGAASVWSTASTGIEFEVKPREAIYLGGFYFRETSRFGRSVTGSSVSLSEQSARDLPAIRAQFSSLASVPLTQSLAVGTKLENVGGASDGRINIPIFISIAR